MLQVQLKYKENGENLKFIFREAKINDAILFFDECESAICILQAAAWYFY